MNSKNLILTSTLILFFFLFNACTLEGEQICGVWNSNGNHGQMKLEITPWEGKFHAYLLEYQADGKTVKGAKEDKFIFLTDLVFEKDSYKNGKIYTDPNSKDFCNISLKLLDENQLEANYDCNGEAFQEIWTRNGAIPSKSNQIKETPTTEKEASTSKTKSTTSSNKKKPVSEKSSKSLQIKQKQVSTSPQKQGSISKAQQATKKQATFYVVGVSQTVAYGDLQALSTAVEALWNKTYNEDFSAKLSNISDAERMYVVYSDYENPKGKMTITIGYKVNDLSNIPSGLKGVKIPANDYYTSPLSGKASDYEGKGWKQLEEVMGYRKADSADFEVYVFDSNYEVTKADIWIASK